MGEGRGCLKGKRELDGEWSLELEHCLVGDGITGWVRGEHDCGWDWMGRGSTWWEVEVLDMRDGALDDRGEYWMGEALDGKEGALNGRGEALD